jgi:hypothetical protein
MKGYGNVKIVEASMTEMLMLRLTSLLKANVFLRRWYPMGNSRAKKSPVGQDMVIRRRIPSWSLIVNPLD